MLEHFGFSSDQLAESDAFDQYARLYANGSDVTRGTGPFRASVKGWRLEGVLLFERHLTGAVHSRTARAGRDGFDHLVVTAVLEGCVIGSAESGFDQVKAGEVVLADTKKPSRTEPRDAHLLTASVTREIMEVAFGGVSALHGRILTPPANAMLVDYMRSLARNVERLEAEALPGLSRAFTDVLSSVGDSKLRTSREMRWQELLRRQAVEQCILSNLGDRSLSVGSVTMTTGLSRSVLYRLFENECGVAHLIQQHRLDAVRRVLDDGERANLRDIARRFGFSGERQLNQQFASRYGASPTAYRARIAVEPDEQASEGRRRWMGWMGEIS